MSNKIASGVTKLVAALEALDGPEERRRAILAALAVFGESAPSLPNASNELLGAGKREVPVAEVAADIHAAGVAWMKRNGVPQENIDQVFHLDGDGVSVLAAIGRGKSSQTINTYLLTGVASLLANGKAEFTDELARKNCEQLGCYDVNNHGKTLKSFDNKFTGSKNLGWKLTVPGLAAAATLLKSVTSQEG